ncbi:MAG TPA: nucleoside recognition protein [Firmicutes bacterium]|uniref:Nucleoside recognition protein n=1 Tax=Candidatus Fermentithermobacillus carboniphilus TaxID=3085328 RepID=A0AAT9LF93_9FIRM|nr:MAG: nucleoside recognition protein [Candidatus Fermentithermobacillus carboniphilus]HHW17969.1 nucleoside recognition protein [Candidatus Fermentithermobacillaceae bacterium]
MNGVWLFLMIFGCVVALFNGNVDAMMSAVLDGAHDAVQLVISLAGMFCLWVGIEKLAEEAGLIEGLAKLSKPLLNFLFPYVRGHEKAMGAISASIISNVLGLSSQTPLGLRAMTEIKAIYGEREEGIQSMITLVVVNAAGFCMFPSSIIAMRAALGSKDPAVVAGPTAVAGLVATVAGLLAHRFFSNTGRPR